MFIPLKNKACMYCNTLTAKIYKFSIIQIKWWFAAYRVV